MLNGLWAGMILVGIVYAAFAGNLEAVTEAVLESSKEAVTLCVTMLGVMAFWTGIMEIAGKAGLIGKATDKLHPFIRWMFPGIPGNHPAQREIAANMIANVLGLGWAATPAGIRAMEEMRKLEMQRKTKSFCENKAASNAMCNFLILNISSLQLIPINVIVYRNQYGSVNPAGIIGPGIAATTASTGVAILFCLLMNRIFLKSQSSKNSCDIFRNG